MSDQSGDEASSVPGAADTKDPRAGGAKVRLAIMAVLAMVALFGTFRGATAEGDDVPIDLAEAAAARSDAADLLDDGLNSIDLDDAPAAALDLVGDDEESEPVEIAETVEVAENVDGDVDRDIEVAAPVIGGSTSDEESASGPAPICVDEEAPNHLAPDAADGSFYFDDFATGRSEWQMLSGDWDVFEGRYVQGDTGGFDRIAELALQVPLPARISVDFETLEGPLGGGFMLAQPTPGSRNGATTVDFTAEGKFVRWGTYEESSGAYSYTGGVGLADDFDPALPHNFAIDLTAEWTIVRIDGTEIGRFGPVSEGQVGLVTSVSSMAFDNFTVTELDN